MESKQIAVCGLCNETCETTIEQDGWLNTFCEGCLMLKNTTEAQKPELDDDYVSKDKSRQTDANDRIDFPTL